MSCMKSFYRFILCSIALLLVPFLSQATSLSPSVLEISGSRGGIVDSTFMIFNPGASEQMYFLDLLGFQPTDETGTPSFLPKETQSDGLVSWIDFPFSEITVPAQSKIEVPFQVVIPDDVSSGGYYAAITASTAPTDIVATNGAIVEAKTAILVLFTVEGETVEKLELLDFRILEKGGSLPLGSYQFRVQNQGNVHLTPRGEIRVSNLFGRTIASMDTNSAEGRVLPASTRLFTESFEEEWDLTWLQAAGYQLRYLMFGPLTAELTLSYGTDEILSAQTSFWLIPWELISLVFATILLLLVVYRGLKRVSSK